MKFNLTKPCANCPFRRDPQFPLGTTRRQQIAESLTDDRNYFPCHQTTQFDESGDYQPASSDQHCAGAMIVLEKHHRPNILMRIARCDGLYTPEQLQDWEQTYDSLKEFAQAEECDR